MKFLVVDDSAKMRRILVSSLQRIGYGDCAEAEDSRVTRRSVTCRAVVTTIDCLRT